MSTGLDDSADGLDRALLSYGRSLAAGARRLLDAPYGDLLVTLNQGGRILSGMARLAQDAAWVTQREGYLIDAADRVLASAGRLEVSLAAPFESEPSVQAQEMRNAVGYFRDIVADVIPAAAYRDPAANLLATIDRAPPAPVLYLQVLPLVDRLLNALRRAGEHAEALTKRAERTLAVPIPGFDPTQAVPESSSGLAFEIDAILGELHRRARCLSEVAAEEPHTYEGAVLECFALTPAELAILLSRHLPSPARGSTN